MKKYSYRPIWVDNPSLAMSDEEISDYCKWSLKGLQDALVSKTHFDGRIDAYKQLIRDQFTLVQPKNDNDSIFHRTDWADKMFGIHCWDTIGQARP